MPGGFKSSRSTTAAEEELRQQCEDGGLLTLWDDACEQELGYLASVKSRRQGEALRTKRLDRVRQRLRQALPAPAASDGARLLLIAALSQRHALARLFATAGVRARPRSSAAVRAAPAAATSAGGVDRSVCVHASSSVRVHALAMHGLAGRCAVEVSPLYFAARSSW